MRIQALILLALLSPTATKAEGDLRYFGYAGVECGWDDPQDDSDKTSYSGEVAGFTNLNMACVDADPTVTADRIRRVAADGATILLNVQPALFRAKGRDLQPQPQREALWALVEQGVKASDVPLDRIILYIVDEPSLHGLTAEHVSEAALFLRSKWPEARLMVVDAKLENGPRPIPEKLDYWGFFDYFHADPGRDPEYIAYLDRAAAGLHPGQSLVLVMDAMHTPHHAETGLSAESMADIALAYERLALARPKVSALMAYAWAGGIDQAWELGVRDLPDNVRATHESIGRRIISP